MIRIPKAEKSYLAASELLEGLYYRMIDPQNPSQLERILYVTTPYCPQYGIPLDGVVFEQGRDNLLPLSVASIWKRCHYKPVRRPILEVTFEPVS